MTDDSGTLHLAELPSSGHRAVQVSANDPVFGAPGPDGSLGKLGQYKVLRQLGCGGMGAVYLAEDLGLQRRVALKVMLPNAAADPQSKERFLREARASAAVKHDNVVTIYQVGEDRNIPFIAMEYLAGAPLDQYLAKKGQLTVQQVLRVGQEAAEGLAAAHALGMIHRDIKPANIWLEAPKGRVKILDFGIARRVAEQPGNGLTGAGTVVGTPGYMSPEQARGKQLDHRSDVFSLGVVLYLLTTGQVPFAGDSVLAVLTALAVDDPAPIRSMNPEVPPALESLVHRMLAKKPDNRPVSAMAVAEELGVIAKETDVPMATAASQSTPQVIYVPIAVTSMGSFSQAEFADLGDTHTEVITDRHPIPKSSNNSGLWIAAGVGLVLAGLLVAGVAVALKKPSPETSADPGPPPPRKDPKPPTPIAPRPFDPTPTGYGLRFAPEQSIVIPGLNVPDDAPFTMEGCITIDESFKATAPVFGTTQRLWTAIADAPQGLLWEAYANVGGSEVKLTGAPVVKGKRTHLALVRSTNEVRFFVDGKLTDTKAARGALGGSGLISMGGEKFAGLVDEFRVSRVARFDRDFTPVMNADRDTLALYRFDEGDGDTLRDVSAGGRDCKIGGTKWANPVVKPPLTNVSQIEWQRMLMKHLTGHAAGITATEQELEFLRKVGVDFFEAPAFDDTALEKLAAMPWASRMRSIEIHPPPRANIPTITDNGLTKSMPSFTNLHRLILSGSRVTDAGLKAVTAVPAMHTIILRGCGITDKSAATVAEFKKLIHLDLSNTRFGDEGVKAVAGHPDLTELHLENTLVTDEGIAPLAMSKKLKVLNVKGTKVTAEAVKKLTESLPELKVQSDVNP